MVGPSGLERVGRMARAYSQDLRDRVIEAGLSGPSLRQAARRFGVAASTAIGWVKRLCVEGDRGARLMDNHACAENLCRSDDISGFMVDNTGFLWLNSNTLSDALAPF